VELAAVATHPRLGAVHQVTLSRFTPGAGVARSAVHRILGDTLVSHAYTLAIPAALAVFSNLPGDEYGMACTGAEIVEGVQKPLR
jgi:hypothetical protein